MARRLPARVNSRLRDDIPSYHELVDLRRLGQTNLGTGKSVSGNDLGLFSYVHLRAPLPPISNSEIFGSNAPESYFLMRRSYDGYVSCTGMFKASFPWATKKEEEEERRYVKDTFPKTSKDETAGNLWVDPTDALTLAEEYGMTTWIEALLDNQQVLPTDRKRVISSPPPFYKDGSEPVSADHLAPPVSATPRRRSTRSRSSSPTKRVTSTRKPRLAKSILGKESSLRHETVVLNGNKDNESTFTTGIDSAFSSTTIKTEEKLTTKVSGEDAISADAESIVVKKEPTVKVEVDSTVEHTGDVEVETTRVKVEYPSDNSSGIPPPESTEEIIEKAKNMVEESKKLECDVLVGGSKKRKADELTSNGVEDDEDTDMDNTPKVKRSKVLEEQLKKEKIKTKALIGLSVGLTLTALIPHFL